MQLAKQQIESMIAEKIKTGKKKFGNEFEFLVIEILGLQKLLAPEPEEKEREIPLTQWNEYHPDPTVPALRMLVFRQHENGFDEVITRRGKRILIKEKAYFQWKNEHSGSGCNSITHSSNKKKVS